MAKYKIWNLSVFKTIIEVSIKTFYRKWDGEALPKQTLSWQPKFDTFLQSYLLAMSNVPHFSIKKEYVIMLKMINFWKKNLAIFHGVKKTEIYFS